MGIVWLSRQLAIHQKSGLKADEIVLSSSFIRPIEACRGDTFHADYPLLGSASIHFD